MELTLEKLIEVIKDRKKQVDKNLKSSAASDYWVGYYDSLGELLEFIEFIEDNQWQQFQETMP